MSSRHRQFLEYHSTIGHLYVPSLTVRMMHESHGYWLTTNKLGVRSDHEYPLEKTEGMRRIAFFGDSFTAGDGVRNADRFTEVVARRFPKAEVLNFGLTHSGTDQQYLVFREIGSLFDADVIVLCPMVENIRRNLRSSLPNRTHDGKLFERSKPFFQMSGGALHLHNVPVPRPALSEERKVPSQVTTDRRGRVQLSVSRMVTRARSSAIRLRLAPKIDLFPEYRNAAGEEWKLMRAIIEHWACEFGKSFVVAPIPWFLQYEQPGVYGGEAFRRRFEELAGRNIHTYDCLPALQRYSVAERRRFTYTHDKHFTTEGHAAFGTALSDVLQGLV